MDLLRRNWFQILLALADKPAHGSAVARAVKAQTDGSITLWPATLYRTLDDLVEADLIRELTEDDHPEGASAKRRYYRITAKGRETLRASAGKMAEWVAAAERRLQDNTA